MPGPWASLLNLLFPAKCACCGEVLPRGGALCGACAPKLRRLANPVLPRGPESALDRLTAVFDYEGAGGALLRAFKFRGRREAYGAHLQAAFEQTTAELYASYQFDAILPVPMHRAAMRERGFNQAEWIAQGLARALGVPCYARTLVKARSNRTQHSLPASERADNVRDVYSVKKLQNVVGKRLLLVDDVCTTGATLEECARVLRRAGAARVCAAAVLHPPKTAKYASNSSDIA